MKLISKNSKTGYSVNFPIERTCDKACPFYQNRTCYGMKGRLNFPQSKAANEARLDMYLNSPGLYINTLFLELEKLQKQGVRHIRVNGVGDTPDRRWAISFAFLADLFPEMSFWVATRKRNIWEGFDRPSNITVRYSDGVEGEHTSNVTTDLGAITCPATDKSTGVHDCKTCGHICWSKEIKNITYGRH